MIRENFSGPILCQRTPVKMGPQMSNSWPTYVHYGRRRPHKPQARECSGTRRRIRTTPRLTTGSPVRLHRHLPPRRSREGSFAARSREPCRSFLKQSAPVVSWTLQFVSPPLAAAAERARGMAKDGGPDWNGLFKWSIAHGDGTNPPRALRSAIPCFRAILLCQNTLYLDFCWLMSDFICSILPSSYRALFFLSNLCG
jgi:hypothetical protein